MQSKNKGQQIYLFIFYKYQEIASKRSTPAYLKIISCSQPDFSKERFDSTQWAIKWTFINPAISLQRGTGEHCNLPPVEYGS